MRELSVPRNRIANVVLNVTYRYGNGIHDERRK